MYMSNLVGGLAMLIAFIIVSALIIFFTVKVVKEIKATVNSIREYKLRRAEGEESDVG